MNIAQDLIGTHGTFVAFHERDDYAEDRFVFRADDGRIIVIESGSASGYGMFDVREADEVVEAARVGLSHFPANVNNDLRNAIPKGAS